MLDTLLLFASEPILIKFVKDISRACEKTYTTLYCKKRLKMIELQLTVSHCQRLSKIAESIEIGKRGRIHRQKLVKISEIIPKSM